MSATPDGDFEWIEKSDQIANPPLATTFSANGHQKPDFPITEALYIDETFLSISNPHNYLGCRFENCRFNGTLFTGKILDTCRFINCHFNDADLSRIEKFQQNRWGNCTYDSATRWPSFFNPEEVAGLTKV